MRLLLLAIVLCLTASVYAEALPPAGDITDSAASDTHPVLSADATWAGSVVIGIAGLFLAAMVIGPIVHSEKVEELPVDSGHDDHHAHHH
jgi:hypothetical protein